MRALVARHAAEKPVQVIEPGKVTFEMEKQVVFATFGQTRSAKQVGTAHVVQLQSGRCSSLLVGHPPHREKISEAAGARVVEKRVQADAREILVSEAVLSAKLSHQDLRT